MQYGNSSVIRGRPPEQAETNFIFAVDYTEALPKRFIERITEYIKQ